MYLRYHHLGQLVNLARNFESWKMFPLKGAPQISIADLYKYPSIAQHFIQQQAELDGKRIILDVVADRKEVATFSYWQDYIGTNADYLPEYVEGMKNIYRDLLLSQPNTQTKIGYEVDNICHNCQRKAPKTDVGYHCVESYGNHYDYMWEVALDLLQDSRLLKNQNISEYSTELGTLRALSATQELAYFYQEAYNQVEGNMPKLIDEGILFDDFDTHFTKVHPKNLGKEKY